MIKGKSKPTPQDLYWERKRREEDEKDIMLPPGLINHGNTCFMNSTLQGLIATPALRDLVYFHDLPAFMQPAQGPSVLARRSPQLTNGHGLGGPNELERTDGMPLGDIFVTVLQKAWTIQDARRKESMSPKEILTTIGRKYDQYLDFRQQDAHEFLRHMLDAMRMEELDIIKKRQPPPPKTKGKRKHLDNDVSPSSSPLPVAVTSSPSDAAVSPSHEYLPPTDEDKLVSFVDMLFGGQLASILVCEKCKKISITHEDFNDLSLSIKPEDYAKDRRKRDRFKKIARKLRIRPPSSNAVNDNGPLSASRTRGFFRSGPRASSVPASPVRRSTDTAPHEEEPPENVDPRRRSFDHPGDDGEELDVLGALEGNGITPTPTPGATEDEADRPEDDRGEEAGVRRSEDWMKVDAEPVVPESKGKGSKDDPWGKLARRISVSMKLAGRDKDSRPPSRTSDRGRKTEPKNRVEPRSPRGPSPSTPDLGEVVDISRASMASPTPNSPRVLSPLRQSTSRRSSATPFKQNHYRNETLTKPLVPQKISEQELAYLRRILADVHPVTGNPLSLLHQVISGSSIGASPAAANSAAVATQALWAKLGHLPGIEECLRMFTAVEVLDGENMVGCHRCWKVANGTYKPRVRENGEIIPEDDSDTEGEDEDDSDSSGSRSAAKGSNAGPVKPPGLNGAPSGSSSSTDSGRVSPASTSQVSTTVTDPSTRPDDATSVSSAPTTITTAPSPTSVKHPYRQDSVMSPLHPGTFGGLPIPQISTTEVDQQAVNNTKTWSSTRAVIGLSLSNESLLTPKARRHKRKHKKDGPDESGGSSSEDEYDDTASDTSAATSFSDNSPSASPSASPRSSVERLPGPLASPRQSASRRVQDKQVPRSKQVVPRRMYKRYLISTPPPVLVIHLKRFQQTGRMHTVSLAGSFKKLDEFVAFPEYLDLAPFLAPRRGDCVSEAKEKEREKTKSEGQEKCVYRLYAVVVHIGNMLGGHYVAYTALPNSVSASASTPTPTPAPTPAPTPVSPPLPALGTPPEVEKPLPPPPPMETHSSQTSDTQAVRRWAYISDTTVRLTTLEEVLKAKAYICMYERI
ncbi:cysteine proteinase [Epithele typhae]|uniref:cysteine proteinase n=1 Tax=Epithele typhae TaxID=378194 RepID=UPI002007FCF7|nr:cysteine proteinase [Epithele typhae]KAH9941094.1 cysteine proteinase [Epithele typhae]